MLLELLAELGQVVLGEVRVVRLGASSEHALRNVQVLGLCELDEVISGNERTLFRGDAHLGSPSVAIRKPLVDGDRVDDRPGDVGVLLGRVDPGRGGADRRREGDIAVVAVDVSIVLHDVLVLRAGIVRPGAVLVAVGLAVLVLRQAGILKHADVRYHGVAREVLVVRVRDNLQQRPPDIGGGICGAQTAVSNDA